MDDIESVMLLLSEREAEWAMTLQPGEFWAWWAGDREVPSEFQIPDHEVSAL